MDFSIIIPMRDEANNVLPLHDAISDALRDERRTYEILFVDDGSRDQTLEVLTAIAQGDSRVRIIKLRKNFGQTAALRAGIEYAQGDVIVTMDGDLQNDPRDIPMLLDKIAEGYDVVTGWRKNRRDPFLSRKVPSRIANALMARMLKVPIHDTGCALKAYRSQLIRQLPLYSEFHRYLPAISAMTTDRIAEVVVRHHPRQFGRSKYGLARTGRVILDVIALRMLTTCSRTPLRWFANWSLVFAVLAIVSGGIAIWQAIGAEEHMSLVLSAICFLFLFLAVQLVGCGVFADLVVRSTARQQPGSILGTEPIREP